MIFGNKKKNQDIELEIDEILEKNTNFFEENLDHITLLEQETAKRHTRG